MRAPIFLSRLVSSTSMRGNRSRQQRQLRMESLEPRWVFSAAPIPGAECIPLAEAAPAEGELVASLPTVGPAYPVVPNFSTQLPPSPQQITTPIAFEEAFPEYIDEAEGESVWHIDMSSSSGGGVRWTFTGMVGSMAGHTGVQVIFGGYLAGHSTTVNQYGEFSYTHDFPPGLNGTVTGKGVDSANVETNIATTFIWT